MKVILYIVALLTLVASAYFVQKNIALHQAQVDETVQIQRDNENKKAEIKTVVDNLRKANDTVKERTDTKNSKIGDLEVLVQNKKGLVKQSAGLNNNLNSLRDEQDNINAVQERIQKLAQKENVPVDKIGEFIEKLDNELKQLNKEHGDLLAEVERYTGDVAVNNGQINEFNTVQANRRKSLKSNGVSSLITSVDNDWGFVVVKPHADASIDVNSKLIVVRGDRHVGRLSINAIEGGRVLANIDYTSIVPGMRIRAGDRVILSKVRTN